MVRKIIFVILGLLIIMPLASAIDAQISVETNRINYGIVIRVIDPQTGNLIGSVYSNTGPSGTGNATYSTSKGDLTYDVLLVKHGQITQEKEFEAMPTIKSALLSFRDISTNNSNEEETKSIELTSNITNETISNETEINNSKTLEENTTENTTEETPEKTTGITGKVISNDSSNFTIPNATYYIIGIVLIAGLLGFLLVRRFRKMPGMTIKNTKQKDNEPEERGDIDDKLRDAEKRIKQAQAEIKELREDDEIKKRRQDKIQRAQEKLKEDQEKLKELRDDDD